MASPITATTTTHRAALVLFFGTLALALLSLPGGVACVPVEELDTALGALRSRGYNLAANAIATSDLRFDLLSAASLTLFAPVDSALFGLGMALPGPDYLSALRSHAVPRRLSAADLRRVPSGAVVPTLLPSRSLRVTVSQNSNTIAVDGVELAVLGIFYGRDVAVHGLRGALSFRHEVGAIDDGAPHLLLRRRSSSIFFRDPKVAPPSNRVNDPISRRSANLTNSSPPKSQQSSSPSSETLPYPAPDIRPLLVPSPDPATLVSTEMTSVAPMDQVGSDAAGRRRYGLPSDPASTAMPLFNGDGEEEGSLKISEPFDVETMSIEEAFDDDNDDEFWDDDLLLV